MRRREESWGRDEMINNQLLEVTVRAGQGCWNYILLSSNVLSCSVEKGRGAGWVVGGHGSHIGTTSLLFDTSAGHPVWRELLSATGGQHHTGLYWARLGHNFFLVSKTGYRFFGIIFNYNFLLLCCFFSCVFFVYS